MTDEYSVYETLKAYPNFSIQHMAAWLHWTNGQGRPDHTRVHVTLVKLALDGKVIWTRGKHLHNHRWKALP